jgi:hypothetical protein
MVYVRYCSSDAWMGDAVAFELQFRGVPTLYAVFTDLMRNMGKPLPCGVWRCVRQR